MGVSFDKEQMTTYIAPGVALKDFIFDLFNEGKSNAEVMDTLGGSCDYDRIAGYRNVWKQECGHEDMHHTTKHLLIDKPLEGQSGLLFYESHGTKGDGSKGEMTKAFEKYGTVVSKDFDRDGDAEEVTYAELAKLHGKTGRVYDGVACDGYGETMKLLAIGITKLIKPTGGWFWGTFNLPNKFCSRYPLLQAAACNYYRTPTPDENDFIDSVARLCFMHGHIADPVQSMVFGGGGKGVMQIVFKLSQLPMPTPDDRSSWMKERLEIAKVINDVRG